MSASDPLRPHLRSFYHSPVYLVLFNARSNQDLKSEAASDNSFGLKSSNSTGAMQACKPIRNGPQTTSFVAIGRALGCTGDSQLLCLQSPPVPGVLTLLI